MPDSLRSKRNQTKDVMIRQRNYTHMFMYSVGLSLVSSAVHLEISVCPSRLFLEGLGTVLMIFTSQRQKTPQLIYLICKKCFVENVINNVEKYMC